MNISVSSRAQTWASDPILIPALTEWLYVQLPRDAGWGTADRVRVRIEVLLNGDRHFVEGQATGGTRVSPDYELRYRLPVMFGEKAAGYLASHERDADGLWRDVPLTRLGELGQATARLVLEWVEGTLDIKYAGLGIETAPAPLIVHKNSVAYDNASAASEFGGDGVLSLSLAASGSTDLAAFMGTAIDGTGAFTMTYDGSSTGVTEHWDTSTQAMQNAGYTKTAIGTGSRTYQATSTLTGPNAHYLGVITFTGAHQTTEYGNVQTATGNGSPLSVTCTGVNSDDMVVDQYHHLDETTPTEPTVGADQTVRNSINNGSQAFRQSTQPGTAGGVMSWTNDGVGIYANLGAVVIKAAAAPAASRILAPNNLRPAVFAPGIAR